MQVPVVDEVYSCRDQHERPGVMAIEVGMEQWHMQAQIIQ